MWSYHIQKWGRAQFSNLRLLQLFQSTPEKNHSNNQVKFITSNALRDKLKILILN